MMTAAAAARTRGPTRNPFEMRIVAAAVAIRIAGADSANRSASGRFVASRPSVASSVSPPGPAPNGGIVSDRSSGRSPHVIAADGGAVRFCGVRRGGLRAPVRHGSALQHQRGPAPGVWSSRRSGRGGAVGVPRRRAVRETTAATPGLVGASHCLGGTSGVAPPTRSAVTGQCVDGASAHSPDR
jgi:hypothetical protein